MSDAQKRRKRLAASLRDNLKRRKAQDRGRRTANGPQEPAPVPESDETSS